MATYINISTVTVGSGGASSIAFTSIPQTYTDLVLLTSWRTSRASVADYVALSFNSLTTSFALRFLGGNGSSANTAFYNTSPDSRIGGQAVGNNSTASIFSNGSIYISNYTSSINKPYSIDGTREDNTTANEMALGAGLWSNVSAITSITLTSWGGSTILEHSSASLYGIKAS